MTLARSHDLARTLRGIWECVNGKKNAHVAMDGDLTSLGDRVVTDDALVINGDDSHPSTSLGRTANGVLPQISEGEEEVALVAMIGEGEEVLELAPLMYTPATFDGVFLSHCLVYNGSAINLMPTNLVSKKGWALEKGAIDRVKVVNGKGLTILGIVRNRLMVGPSRKARMVPFIVSPDVSTPILGMPILKAYGLTPHPEDHTLVDNTTRLAVLCETATPKNE